MRILAIDLGARNIKAVELDTVFGRFEIQDQHERPVDITAQEAPEKAAAALIAGLAKKPDRVVAMLRTSEMTFRNLNLPTRDRKAVQASIRFELEDDLPFELAKTVYDSATIPGAKTGTRVHIAATLKTTLQSFLDSLATQGIHPDVVTTEAWALRALCNRVLPIADQTSPAVVLHLGHERTVLYAHFQQAPLLIREIPWGGRDLTMALCQALGLPLEAAEKTLVETGMILSNAELEQKPPAYPQEALIASRALSEALDPLIREIRQALLASKAACSVAPGLILTSGLPSLIPGLAREISESLHLPTRPLQALSATALSGVTYSETTDSNQALALAAGLCIVGPDKNTVVNFRKGEFAKRGSGGKHADLTALKRPLRVLGVVAASFYLSLFVESWVYQSRISDVNEQLERSVKSFFGTISSSAVRQYVANVGTLKTAMQKEITKQREIAKLLSPNPRSPLDHLRTLSASVPKDTVVDLMQYQIGAAPSRGAKAEETVSLTFWVTNPSVAEKIANLVSAKIDGATRSKVEEATGTDGIKKWKITVSGKPLADAYGDSNGK